MQRSMEYKAGHCHEEELWHSGGHSENKFYGSNMNKFGSGGANAHMGFASAGKVKPSYGVEDEHVIHKDKYMMNSVMSNMHKVHVPEKTMKMEFSYSSATGVMNGGHGFGNKHNMGTGLMSGGHGFGNKHQYGTGKMDGGHGFGNKHNFGAGHGIGDKHSFGAGMKKGGHGFGDKHNYSSMMNSGHGFGEKHKFHVPEKTMKMHDSYEYSSYHSEETYRAHHNHYSRMYNDSHSVAWMAKCL